jgi:hypothetical protein
VRVQIQISRVGAEAWHVTKCSGEKGVFTYETLARVVKADGLYWVEWVEWKEEGHGWKRDTRRGYLLPETPFKIAAKGPPQTEVM